jgi:hypothetical protein
MSWVELFSITPNQMNDPKYEGEGNSFLCLLERENKLFLTSS